MNPIFAKNDVTNSIGQTMHHILPKNMALIIIIGHQYDQISKLARLKFRKYFKKADSDEFAENPITSKVMKTKPVMYLNAMGKNDFFES